MSRRKEPGETRLLVIDSAPEKYTDLLARRFPDVRIECCTSVADQSAMADALRPQVVLSFRMKGMTPESQAGVFETSSVEWLHVGGAGIEHIPHWDGSRMIVTNSSGVLSRYLAEYVIGAMLMVNVGFPCYLQQMQQREWRGHYWRPVEGRTLLIIGLGNIGKCVAVRARALGMRVIGMRSRPAEVEEFDELTPLARLHDALARADFVTLHVPLTDSTRGLINDKALASMKPHAWLINTSRGPVVDEAALINVLTNEKIRGAVLDVFDTEPLPSESPLWDLPNA
ncbi:MAG: D-2-hydroxyacid dehydrogenase, partial [Gammaproteobacteria bacterium]